MYLILSNGHSATRWIAEILTKENFSKCYHSYNLLNTNRTINNIISYHKFLKEINLNKKLIVGSIHLPLKQDIKSLTELMLLDVKIVYLLRNPIDKINSMMQFYLEKYISEGFFLNNKPVLKKNKEINFYIEDIFKECSDQINTNFKKYQSSKIFYYLGYAFASIKFKIIKKIFNLSLSKELLTNKNHKDYLSKVVTNLFLFTCSSCLRFDDQASKHNQSEIVLIEKIVQNEKSFLQFAKILNTSFELENLNIEKFYKKLGKNVKNYNKTF
ncbi:sulfotransferase domain-containing protein, partial [Candidatus Pelagibacter sp.]|nr:sulfotransferase domain-containing protein [Candidatus Pelagibacter sp.]